MCSQVLRHVTSTGVWPESVRFPTVTLCDFAMRVHHNVQNHTVQCALPLNFYHERLFVSLWVWYTFLATCALLSLVAWTLWVVVDVVPYIWRQGCRGAPPAAHKTNHAFPWSRGSTGKTPTSSEASEETAKQGLLNNNNSNPHQGAPLYAQSLSLGGSDESVKRFMWNNFRANGVFIKRMMQSNVGLFTTKQFIIGIREELRKQRKVSDNMELENIKDKEPEKVAFTA